jgi:hypothetical protein
MRRCTTRSRYRSNVRGKVRKWEMTRNSNVKERTNRWKKEGFKETSFPRKLWRSFIRLEVEGDRNMLVRFLCFSVKYSEEWALSVRSQDVLLNNFRNVRQKVLHDIWCLSLLTVVMSCYIVLCFITSQCEREIALQIWLFFKCHSFVFKLQSSQLWLVENFPEWRQ